MRHVHEQFAHALALGIAALQEVFLLVLRHVGMVKDALQIAVYAGGRGFQLVGSILGELAFEAELVLLAMAQFPV